MESQDVFKKIQEAIKAFEEYEKDIKSGKRGLWYDEIKKGMETLTEKRHVLASSGQTCPRCNGSGRI